VTKSQGELAILGVFYPINNALYSIAFETHTITAEPIELPFGLMTRAGPRYHVLDGGPEPRRERDNVWGLSGHSKVLAIFAATVAAASLKKGSFNRQ